MEFETKFIDNIITITVKNISTFEQYETTINNTNGYISFSNDISILNRIINDAINKKLIMNTTISNDEITIHIESNKDMYINFDFIIRLKKIHNEINELKMRMSKYVTDNEKEISTLRDTIRIMRDEMETFRRYMEIANIDTRQLELQLNNYIVIRNTNIKRTTLNLIIGRGTGIMAFNEYKKIIDLSKDLNDIFYFDPILFNTYGTRTNGQIYERNGL